MDKIKNVASKVKNIPGKVKNAIGNAGVKPIQDPNSLTLFQQGFDNIVWVIVLVGVLFLAIIAFLSTQTFFTNNKINKIMKRYPNRNQLKALEFSSPEGKEEEVDEIDIKTHRLTDVQICSSAKSYLVGRQLLDYGSGDMVIQTLKMGAKFIELDIFENRKHQLMVTNGLRAGNWKLTLNQIKLGDICKKLANFLFNPDVMANFNDPQILFLNLNIPKNRMEEVAQIIKINFQSVILDEKFSISGKQSILEVPLQDLIGKLIIMTSGAIGDTSLDKLVHLRLGDRLKRIHFNDLQKMEKKDMIQFNKHHLTIVHPPLGFRSINYNPETAFDYGCQIVCFFFQRADDFLQEYLTHFSSKSFRIKPFEYTRMVDIPQKGYNPDKIAYYDTYTRDIRDEDDVLVGRLNDNNKAEEKGCCLVNVDDSMFSENVLSQPNKDYKFNTIRLKLQKLNVAEHEDIRDIEVLPLDNKDRLQVYIDKHIFLEDTKELIQNKLDLIYFILTKQLKKALSKERNKLFTTDYEDKCVNLDAIKCNEEPICFYNRDEPKKNCGSKLDSLPFPKYCMPRYEVPNRASCFFDAEGKLDETKDKDTSKEKLRMLKNKTLRGIFHKTMTEHNFFGKWSGKEGDFEIPNSTNPYCEFKFVTPIDDKEYTMYLVDDSGNNIPYQNTSSTPPTINGSRAKGTFVDRKLRAIEDRLNLPRLSYHGFADFKILDKTVDKLILGELENKVGKCLKQKNILAKTNTDVLLGLYQYSSDVTGSGAKYSKGTVTDIYVANTNDLVYNSEDSQDINKYLFRMINPECNVQLQTVFDRLPKANIREAQQYTKPSITLEDTDEAEEAAIKAKEIAAIKAAEPALPTGGEDIAAEPALPTGGEDIAEEPALQTGGDIVAAVG